MNKTEFIKVAAKKMGATQKDTAIYLDGILDTIRETLESGDSVKLSGFGNFEVAQRAARTGHNPSTGETIDIPASKAPKFRASSSFKDAVKKA